MTTVNQSGQCQLGCSVESSLPSQQGQQPVDAGNPASRAFENVRTHARKRLDETALSVAVWHAPTHWRAEDWEKIEGEWVFNPALTSQPALTRPPAIVDSADEWEKYLFAKSQNNLPRSGRTPWQRALPRFHNIVHPSLQAWVRQTKHPARKVRVDGRYKNVRDERDRNYFADERMSRMQTNGIIPAAGTTAGVAHSIPRENNSLTNVWTGHNNADGDSQRVAQFQYVLPRRSITTTVLNENSYESEAYGTTTFQVSAPDIPQGYDTGGLSEEEIQENRERLERSVQDGAEEVRKLVRQYDADPLIQAQRRIHASIESLTPDLINEWNANITQETKWEWMDDNDRADEVYAAALAQAAARAAQGDGLWLEEIRQPTKNKKRAGFKRWIYHSALSRTSPEPVFVRVKGLRGRKSRDYIKEDSESGQIHAEDFDYSAQITAESMATVSDTNPSVNWRVDGNGDDEDSDPGFGTDGISYDGVQKSSYPEPERFINEDQWLGAVKKFETRHPNIGRLRRDLQRKYQRLVERTKHLTTEERLAALEKEKDATKDASLLLLRTENRSVKDSTPDGEKPNTHSKELSRGLETIRRAGKFPARIPGEPWEPALCEAFAALSGEKRSSTLEQGGLFITVELNGKRELKRLGAAGMTDEEMDDAWYGHAEKSCREVRKTAEKTAKKKRLRADATNALIQEACRRIVRAYETTTDGVFVVDPGQKEIYPHGVDCVEVFAP